MFSVKAYCSNVDMNFYMETKALADGRRGELQRRDFGKNQRHTLLTSQLLLGIGLVKRLTGSQLSSRKWRMALLFGLE